MNEYELQVKIGRLQRKIEKLQKQRDHYKQLYEHYAKVISLQPHLHDRYQSFQEKKARHEEYKMLKVRVKEQEELIKRLMTQPVVTVPSPVFKGCTVCGIGSNVEVMGYVCVRQNCPSKVSC